jgi:hypothetical protein
MLESNKIHLGIAKCDEWSLFETINGSYINEKNTLYHLKHKVSREVNKFNIVNFIVFNNSTLGKGYGVKYVIFRTTWSSNKGGYLGRIACSFCFSFL